MEALSRELDRLSALRQELAGNPDILYQRWWSVCVAGSPDVDDSPPREGVATEYHGDRRVTLLRGGLPFGTVTDSRSVGLVASGDWLSSSGSSRVVRLRRKWSEDAFCWRQSELLRPVCAARWRLRLYVPSRMNSDPMGDLDGVAAALDAAGLWYQCKCRLGHDLYRDALVIWVSARDGAAAVRTIRPMAGEPNLRVGPPPMTLAIEQIGVARDLANGQSFGWRASQAVAVALARQSEPQDLASCWDATARRLDLDPVEPWRHPWIDPHGCWAELRDMG
jgi:hypothetical protein